MKTHTFNSLVLATALALGLGASARADSALAADQPVSSTTGSGLLGQVYGTLTYSYVNLDNSSAHLDTYDFEINQPLAFGLDGFGGYSYGSGGGSHSNVLDAGLRAFSTHYNWGKPFVEAGAGYAWTRVAGVKDNSFIWEVTGGAEFQVAPYTTVTPYIQYVDAPDLAGDSTWNFGVKGNYWVTPQWAVTAGLQVDNDHNTGFTVGTNFRF